MSTDTRSKKTGRARFGKLPQELDRPEDRLDYMDEATFLSYRASGRVQVMLAMWFYEGPVDLDGLRRFHENFGRSLAARRIERSRLPFGRARWVAAPAVERPLDIAETARPRSELTDWLEERSQIPINPEHGPGWHLGVQPFTDGSTAVVLALSHCLIDGTGAVAAIIGAVLGQGRDLGYAQPGSRTRWQGIRADLRQARRDWPEVRRTVVAAAKMLHRRRHEISKSGDTRPAVTAGNADEHVLMPFAGTHIDVEQWDAMCETLGGNTYSLAAAFAARLGVRMERHRQQDGNIALMVAVNDRTSMEDTRANAMAFANLTVDPTHVAKDLTDLRAALRTSLANAKDQPDESFILLPLTPFIPRRAVNRTADLVLGDMPVTCSNFAQLPDLMCRPDGANQATFLNCWGVEQNVKKSDIERPGGLLVVASGRYNGRVNLGVVGYQVGAENTRAVLRERIKETLDEFGLTPLTIY
ncbi:hypothetical protein FZI85_03250 [Mycobacterium sp. CBMA293]|uniref:hypothetical protein n=1 Tax=unclassified Mycolicibacterium TaxID=2636767 RepID=UPI0012DE14D5|nr:MULTISPECIES: hypothetical protein [unclassified Mycolicibacterium]MUL46951.1 hypothetical protein [Mycolicibacterium sp. CBMA 360]MUL58327.1 hypothetical protein [Mycolicibacterium sp. CBMA 335]MUL73785.1 hypothetical protein [Mycolicibacterium sp. CBMA 311]MUL93210.1 hypothetical protein [Mycolicibacterium sp. CBMA 230]MUM07758.1 hypothetical protein [Mycolicibacterium sp. CBMA 213]